MFKRMFRSAQILKSTRQLEVDQCLFFVSVFVCAWSSFTNILVPLYGIVHLFDNSLFCWLNWLGEFVEVYHVVLLLPKNCLVFWKRQPWVFLADVTLLVGVHKYLYFVVRVIVRWNRLEGQLLLMIYQNILTLTWLYENSNIGHTIKHMLC